MFSSAIQEWQFHPLSAPREGDASFFFIRGEGAERDSVPVWVGLFFICQELAGMSGLLVG